MIVYERARTEYGLGTQKCVDEWKYSTETAGPKEKIPFLMMFIIKLSLIKPPDRLRRNVE